MPLAGHAAGVRSCDRVARRCWSAGACWSWSGAAMRDEHGRGRPRGGELLGMSIAAFIRTGAWRAKRNKARGWQVREPRERGNRRRYEICRRAWAVICHVTPRFGKILSGTRRLALMRPRFCVIRPPSSDTDAQIPAARHSASVQGSEYAAEVVIFRHVANLGDLQFVARRPWLHPPIGSSPISSAHGRTRSGMRHSRRNLTREAAPRGNA